ncbi:hypothetical protein G6F40_016481 [Rhizopus arrhizus]|nr:hypothetical protein G6F40_016481 [Rhizopus arrhizus]
MLSASTRTLSSSTVPLAVVRWPKLDQSSTTDTPGAPRSRTTVTSLPSASSTLVGIHRRRPARASPRCRGYVGCGARGRHCPAGARPARPRSSGAAAPACQSGEAGSGSRNGSAGSDPATDPPR